MFSDVLVACPLAAEAGVLIDTDHIRTGDSIVATPDCPGPPSYSGFSACWIARRQPGSEQSGADDIDMLTFTYDKPGAYQIDWQFSEIKKQNSRERKITSLREIILELLYGSGTLPVLQNDNNRGRTE